MKPMDQLSLMFIIVADVFHGKTDKSGRLYIFHCLKVMQLLESDDDELNCIALGHDLIEDSDWTFEDLKLHMFSDRVIEGIKSLTRQTGETEAEYRARVKANPDAVRVKMCDLRHNSDITRLKGVTEKDIKRTIKYHEFYTELKLL